jgi:hypothetical protein
MPGTRSNFIYFLKWSSSRVAHWVHIVFVLCHILNQVAFFFSIEVSSGLFILESQYFVTNMQVDTNVLLLLLGVRENRSCIHSQSLWEMNVLSSCFHQIYLDESAITITGCMQYCNYARKKCHPVQLFYRALTSTP